MSLQMQAEAIRQMRETDGWLIVAKFLEEKLEYHRTALLNCPLEEVMKHRQMLETYRSIPVHLEGIIQDSLIEE
ncbi:MAG: hypothetical protein JW384_03063 [Nitrosomonadaceae bacterium]|nr:hypothetical protein [Nitrosomonadaceae bacterium]